MFCSGVSMLADGQIFSAGGGATIKTTSIYDGNNWANDDPMITPRWYPTSTSLPSGQVLTSLGTNSTGVPELWTPDVGWSLMPNVSLQSVLNDVTASYNLRSWFPALSVAPDGTLFHAGPTSRMLTLDLTQFDGITDHGSRESDNHHRLYNTTVMYDIGKILVAGGGTPAIDTAVTIDLNGGRPSVAATSALNYARSLHNSIALPNGEVLVVGGSTSGIQFSDSGTNLIPEIWNPQTGQWRTVSAAHQAEKLSLDCAVAEGWSSRCHGRWAVRRLCHQSSEW